MWEDEKGTVAVAYPIPPIRHRKEPPMPKTKTAKKNTKKKDAPAAPEPQPQINLGIHGLGRMKIFLEKRPEQRAQLFGIAAGGQLGGAGEVGKHHGHQLALLGAGVML